MFLTDLVVRELDHDRWQLEEDLVYEGRADTFTVPKGTLTDFASIPSQLRWFIPKYGRYNRAAVLHDWLIREQGSPPVGRADADGIFRRSMREIGVGFVRRWLMWAAVRVAARLEGASSAHATLAIAIAVVALPVVLPGITIAQVLMWSYQLLEMAVYGIRTVVARMRGHDPPKDRRPRLHMYWTAPERRRPVTESDV